MSLSIRNRAAVCAAALGLVVVAVPSGAIAGTPAPPVTASSVITTTLPAGGNPGGQNLNIYGAFSGLRPGESLVGYDAWITCDDFRTFDITLGVDTVTKYPGGAVGGTVLASIPASEQGHRCRMQASAPAGRRLVFDTSGWQPFVGTWQLTLQGYVVTIAPEGGLY